MTGEILYLIVAECPLCGGQNRIVESREKPVNLMQDVRITVRCCELCGREVGRDGHEWDVHEEAEIERVQPTQERENQQKASR